MRPARVLYHPDITARAWYADCNSFSVTDTRTKEIQMTFNTIKTYRGFMVVERCTIAGWDYEIQDMKGRTYAELRCLPAQLKVIAGKFEAMIDQLAR